MFIIGSGVWEQSGGWRWSRSHTMQGPCRQEEEGNSCHLVSSTPKSLSPSQEWDGNLQTGDICKPMDQDSLEKPSVCITLKDSLGNDIWFSNHFGISVLVILAVISCLHSHQYYWICLSCCVIALLIHYWQGRTTALPDNSPSTPHLQITALLFYCNSVFSSWSDTELMLMVAFTCPEDRLNERTMPFMIFPNSLCVDLVKHLPSSFLFSLLQPDMNY